MSSSDSDTSWRRFVRAVSDVPWGNLWRWVVSSLAISTVSLAVMLAVAVPTSLDEGATALAFDASTFVLVLSSPLVAALVVWSDEVSWVGDPRY